MSKNLALSKIRLDGGTQPRSILNAEMIEEFAELMGAGVNFPAVIVFYDGESYWLADGFHRVKAAWQSNLGGVEAEIIQGTLDEAKWYSFGVNKAHGLRRTNEDKQRCIRAALEHPKSQGLSDREISRHIGVADSTVGEWRRRLSAVLPQIAEITVTRGGTTYKVEASRMRRHIDAAETAPPVPRNIQLPAIDRKAAWACQIRRNFEKEFLRLLKAYEKSNPAVDAIVVTRTKGIATGIEIASSEKELAV